MLGFTIANNNLKKNDILDSIPIKGNKCLARVWGKGDYGKTQCSNIITKQYLCEKHYEASLRMNGKWWLGLITEERPDEPLHPISGKHKWSKDINGNNYETEIIIKTKKEENNDIKVKRPRGRPKGSKNKKKKISDN